MKSYCRSNKIKDIQQKIEKQNEKIDNCFSYSWYILCIASLLILFGKALFGPDVLLIQAVSGIAIICLIVSAALRTKICEQLHDELIDLLSDKK